jgi:heme-degrading monooxygenase HmoA
MSPFPIATPPAPYYAVIFTSRRSATDKGYDVTAARMIELAAATAGFLGAESVRATDGCGITVSYWTDLDAIRRWRADSEHQAAQQRGRSDWYSAYHVRISRVERAYDFSTA